MVVAVALVGILERIVIKKCIDATCSFNCDCNDTTTCSNQEDSCNNNISVQFQVIVITQKNFSVSGNLNITGSSLNISETILLVDKNFTLTNSSISFTGISSIAVNGCISLDSVNISIDLSKYAANNQQHSLLNSSKSCVQIVGSPVSFLNQPNCTNAITQLTESSLELFLSTQSCSSQSQSNNYWELSTIVISILLFLVIAFTIAAITIKPLRTKIFVRDRVRNDIKNKISKRTKEEVEDKLEDLKDDIKSLNDEHDRVKNMLDD